MTLPAKIEKPEKPTIGLGALLITGVVAGGVAMVAKAMKSPPPRKKRSRSFGNRLSGSWMNDWLKEDVPLGVMDEVPGVKAEQNKYRKRIEDAKNREAQAKAEAEARVEAKRRARAESHADYRRRSAIAAQRESAEPGETVHVRVHPEESIWAEYLGSGHYRVASESLEVDAIVPGMVIVPHDGGLTGFTEIKDWDGCMKVLAGETLDG